MDKNDYEQTAIQEKNETTTRSLKSMADSAKDAQNTLNSLGGTLDWLIDKLKLLDSIEIGTKMLANLKNVGMAESDQLAIKPVTLF